MLLLIAALASAAELPASEVESVLASELDRAVRTFSEQPEKPHYVALSVEDWEEIRITGQAGTLSVSRDDRARYLDVDLRVGDPTLDSTRQLRGFSALESEDRQMNRVPLDDAYALRHALWRELDARYRDAVERIVIVRANRNVKVEEEDPSNDFEPRTKVVDRQAVPELAVDEDRWEALLADLSEERSEVRLTEEDGLDDAGRSEEGGAGREGRGPRHRHRDLHMEELVALVVVKGCRPLAAPSTTGDSGARAGTLPWHRPGCRGRWACRSRPASGWECRRRSTHPPVVLP